MIKELSKFIKDNSFQKLEVDLEPLSITVRYTQHFIPLVLDGKIRYDQTHSEKAEYSSPKETLDDYKEVMLEIWKKKEK